jgi:hypothetical protein
VRARNLIRNLPQNCAIILGNASYHSVLLEKIPPKSEKENKESKQTAERLFSFWHTQCQPALYEYVLIKRHKPKIKKRFFDEIFTSHGHRVFGIIMTVGGPNRDSESAIDEEIDFEEGYEGWSLWSGRNAVVLWVLMMG